MFTVRGDVLVAFVDAVKVRLTSDTVLSALVEGVFGHVSEAARTAYPYIVLGRRGADNQGGAMGMRGGQVTLQIDVFSNAKGPYEASLIGSGIVARLERRPLTLVGFTILEGSMTCELNEVDDEPDADKPGARLYHAVQRWTAEFYE